MKIKAYHGTNFEFERFDISKLGISCDNPTTLFGFFFSESLDDALSWATRASERRRVQSKPSVVTAEFEMNNPIHLPYEVFVYYLKHARRSTITRHKEKWIDEGHDGLMVVRDGIQWYCPFDASTIEIKQRFTPRAAQKRDVCESPSP